MAKTIIQTSTSSVLSLSSTTANYIRIGGRLTFTTTDSDDTRIPFQVAGTLSDLHVNISANATSANSTLRTRKNGANGGQTITITAGNTGIFDGTGTDSVSVNDVVNHQVTLGSANTVTFTTIQMLFAATTNTVTKLIAAGSSGLAGSTTYYIPLGGNHNSVTPTSETNVKVRMRKAGTFKNLVAYLGGMNATLTLRKNGADTAISATTSDTSAQFIKDTSNTSTCAVNDDFNFVIVVGTVTATSLSHISIEFETTDGSGLIVNANASTGTASTFVKTTTNYLALGGAIITAANATEASAQTKAKEAFTFSDLEVFCTGVSGTTTNTLTLMKGGSATSLVCTISTSTGIYQDTTHTETVTATDLLDYQLVNTSSAGGTHNIVITWIAMFYTSGAAGGNNVVIAVPTETIGVSDSRTLLRNKIRTRSESISCTD